MNRTALIVVALVLGLAASAAAQRVAPGNLFNSIILGASGTEITQIRLYAASITPAQTSAAIQTAEQTFTVTGLATTDRLFVNGPAPTSLCPPTTFRASATNTIAIGFTVLTAAACTPASGTYNIVAIR